MAQGSRAVDRSRLASLAVTALAAIGLFLSNWGAALGAGILGAAYMFAHRDD